MRRLTFLLLLIHITLVVACYPLELIDYSFRGINFSKHDPRLFTYNDSIYINKQKIESLLKIICVENNFHGIRRDNRLSFPDFTPSADSSFRIIKKEEMEIIELANVFVKKGEVNIIYDIHRDTIAPIKKSDLEKLYISFSDIQNIDAKDIIDIININKQTWNYPLMNSPILPMSGYSTQDSLDCELKKITGKYKYGVTDTTPCPKGYSLLEDSSLSVKEKIAELEYRVMELSFYSRRYGGIYDAKILRLKQNIDSLNRLPTQHK